MLWRLFIQDKVRLAEFDSLSIDDVADACHVLDLADAARSDK